MGNPTASLKANRKVVKVPKGTSKYQAAWIVDDEEEGSQEDDDEDDDIDDDMMEEAVSQVLPRTDTAGDLHGGIAYPRTILSFQLAPCKGTTQSQDLPGFPLLNLLCVSCCFFSLLDTEMRHCGVLSYDSQCEYMQALQCCMDIKRARVLTGSVLFSVSGGGKQ